MKPNDVLGPAVAGSWYPSGRRELGALVDRLLEDAGARMSGPDRPSHAVIAPHAGFAYSGPVAAVAFQSLAKADVRRVIVLGPSHYFDFAGAAIPGRAKAYRTPLGDAPLDAVPLASLGDSPDFRADDRLFEPEHSLESELPFIQRLFGDGIPLVPILIGGGTTPEVSARIAAALAPLLDTRTLFVVSSDFTHYGPRFGYTPFYNDVPARLAELDLGAVRAIEAGDATAFARYVDATGATICGRHAIDVLLRLKVAASGGTLLERDTSGRMTGTFDHSVSYAAVAFAGTT